MFKWTHGELYRERVKAPVGSEPGTKAWGEHRQSELSSRGRKAVERKAVPTFLPACGAAAIFPAASPCKAPACQR
jgi:hypothetical protein